MNNASINYHHRQKVIRIHVYFGSICKTLVIDKTHSFESNFFDTLRSFGINSHPEKYKLKLANGGVVDNNESLMNEDRVLIIPLQEVL